MTSRKRQPQSVSRQKTQTRSKGVKSKTSQPAAKETSEKTISQLTSLHAELTALHLISTTVSSSLNLEEVLYETANLVKDVMGGETVAIFTVDGPKRKIVLRADRGVPKDILPLVDGASFEQSLSGQAAASGEQIYVGDVLNDPKVDRRVLKHFTEEFPGSLVATPLRAAGKVLGVLTLRDKRPNRFNQRDLEFLNSTANAVAIAIQNANLFEEAARRSRQLKALVKINRDVASLLDRETLLPRIAEEAGRILAVEGVSFRLIEGDYLVRVGYAGEEIRQFRPKLRLGESISGKVISENRAIAVREILESPLLEEHRELLHKGGYHSLLGVPLRVGERVIGSVLLYSKKERDFQPEEIDLFSAFADQAAIAIENAKLFREVQEANNAKSEFMAAMSHELRTPINVIIGNAELLGDGFFGDTTEKQRDAVGKIRRYAESLLKLVDQVLKLTRTEAKKMTLDISTFSLEEVLDQIRTFVEAFNRDYRVDVLWDVDKNLPLLTSDALKVEEILQNLVGNAFKFTLQGRIEIRVRDLPSQKRIQFSIADTGIGVEKENLEHIFEEFYQLKAAHTGRYSGVGLGLSIVKKYLDLMQGEIRVESEPGKGSTFTFALPYSVP